MTSFAASQSMQATAHAEPLATTTSCTQTVTETTGSATACHACQTLNAVDAAFCVECGSRMGAHCPACSHPVGEGDFCEACGHWMHPGKCRFCYSVLTEGAAFCEECGCDQSGLWCEPCQTRSFFDFCGGCGAALSESGAAALAQQAQDPQLARLIDELKAAQQAADELMADEPVAAAPVRRRLLDPKVTQTLRALGAATPVAVPQPALAGATVVGESESLRQSRQEAIQQLGRSKLSLSERLRAAKERAAQLASETATKTFADQQEARRYFMGFRKLLAAEGHPPRAWLCNAYHSEHETPNDCAAPHQGGVWLFDTPVN